MYQSLEDLKLACTDAARETAMSDGREGERPVNFEVGVFCGSYVTPVDEEYFLHLERVRGQNRKSKVATEARRAVASGMAEGDQVTMAANGVDVDESGRVVPVVGKQNQTTPPVVRTNGNGNGNRITQQKNESWASGEETPSVRANRVDIALHNFADDR